MVISTGDVYNLKLHYVIWRYHGYYENYYFILINFATVGSKIFKPDALTTFNKNLTQNRFTVIRMREVQFKSIKEIIFQD